MNDQAVLDKKYMVTIHEPDEGGALVFTFVPKDGQQNNGWSNIKRVPHIVVGIGLEEGRLTFDWSRTSDDIGARREEIEAEIAARMNARRIWIERVNDLVSQVEQWAREMNWSTRRIEKKIEDSWIGNHRVPALLMQEGICRALLEPVGQSSRGEGGVVDLYLMPAYDDVANLFYYDNRWNLHYNTSRGTNAVAPAPGGDALSKETLATVLSEMKRNAA